MHVVVATVVHHPGDARIYHRQIPALLAAGHRVTYVAPPMDPATTPWDGLAHLVVPRAEGRHRLAALRAARRELAAITPRADVTIVHDPELTLLWRSIAAPRIWDVHEDLPAQLSDKAWVPGALRWIGRPPARLLERLGAAHFSIILAEQAYRDRFGDHPVVPNTPWAPDSVAPSGEDRVVYLGRLSVQRGAHDLVDLSTRLPPGVRLELLGPVDRAIPRGSVESGPAITVHGFVPNDDALARIEGAMAGLSLLHDRPNYRHSLPTKLLEYMARGVPVITTPLPEARALVERHDCGIVVPFGDPAAAADAVRSLHGDVGLRARYAANGRRAVLDRYDWRHHGEQFVATCEAIAGRSVGNETRRSRRSNVASTASKHRPR